MKKKVKKLILLDYVRQSVNEREKRKERKRKKIKRRIIRRIKQKKLFMYVNDVGTAYTIAEWANKDNDFSGIYFWGSHEHRLFSDGILRWVLD